MIKSSGHSSCMRFSELLLESVNLRACQWLAVTLVLNASALSLMNCSRSCRFSMSCPMNFSMLLFPCLFSLFVVLVLKGEALLVIYFNSPK